MKKPNPPNWLDKLGKEYWRKLVERVEMSGTNYDTLALLCSGLSLYRKAEEYIQTHEIASDFSGRKNGAFDVQKQAFVQIKDCLRILKVAVDESDEDIFP